MLQCLPKERTNTLGVLLGSHGYTVRLLVPKCLSEDLKTVGEEVIATFIDCIKDELENLSKELFWTRLHFREIGKCFHGGNFNLHVL